MAGLHRGCWHAGEGAAEGSAATPGETTRELPVEGTSVAESSRAGPVAVAAIAAVPVLLAVLL